MKKESKISVTLKNSQGFTLLELMTVIGIVAVLATMAVLSGWDSRKKAQDLLALYDAKNILTIVGSSFLEKEDIDFDTNGNWVTQIGTTRWSDGGARRVALYTLSPRVVANATGFSSKVDPGNISIYLYNTSGTGVSFALYPGIKVRTFYVNIDEATGDVDTSFRSQ